MKIWHIVVLLLVTTIAMLLAAGQVITFAWLSAFPEQAHRLSVLEGKVWAWTVVGVVLLAVNASLLVMLVRKILKMRADGALQRTSMR